MTDRIGYLTVILTHDFRDDDVEGVVSAIAMVRGVENVILGKPTDATDMVARLRAENKWRERLRSLLGETPVK